MLEIVTQTLKNLLFPKQCFNCKTWGNFICDSCRSLLKTHPHQRCLVCQKPSLQGWTHPACHGKNKPERLITIFDYHDQTIRRLINTAKLSLVPEIFTELAGSASCRIELRSKLFTEFVVCPIPQIRSKTSWRGFNQSKLISEVLARHYGLAIDQVISKSVSTKEQKTLNKFQRKNNLSKVFQILQPQSIPSNVLLVDDITTTGSTFLEAARTLKRAGVQAVWCLALAQD